MLEFKKGAAPRLVGIAGTLGAGKDTGAIHIEQYGLMHVSTGDVLRAEARRLGINPDDREALVALTVELQAQYGSFGSLTLQAIEQWQSEETNFTGGLVVSGLRILEQAAQVRAHNGVQLFVDADTQIRLERIRRRARNEEETIMTLEQLKGKEIRDYGDESDPARPNLFSIMAIADVVIINDGDKDSYVNKVQAVLGLPD